jgi:tetratricopeptide (TPR) repeat protein
MNKLLAIAAVITMLFCSSMQAAEGNRQLAKDEFHKGVTFAYEGDFANAIVHFETAVQADKYYEPAQGGLSIVRQVVKDKIGKDAAISVFKANRLMDEKKFSAAIAEYQKAIALNPKWSVPYTNLGIALLGQNKESEAVEWFKKALDISPDPEAHSNMGLYWVNLGQLNKAIEEFQKCIDLNPRPRVQSTCLCNMGLAYEQKNMLDKAIELYKKALEIDPTDPEAYYSLATSYYYKDDYARAIEYCEKARQLGREIHPNFEKALEPYRKKAGK